MFKKIKYLNKNFFFLPYFFLFFYIIGPAPTDILLTLLSLYGLWLFIIKKDIRIKYFNYLLFFSLFYFLICLSAIKTNYNLHDSLYRAIPYFRYFFFIIPIVEFFSDKKKLLFLLEIILVLILFVCLASLFQIFSSYNLIGISVDRHDRLSGLFSDELVVGTQLFSLLIIFLFSFIDNKYLQQNFRLILFLVIIFSSIIIIKSGERMIFYKLLLSLAIFNIIYFKNIFKSLIIYLIFTLSFLSLIIFTPSLKDRFVTQFIIKFTNNENLINFQNADDSFKNFTPEYNLKYFLSSGHGILFISAFEIFKDNPYLGVGPKQFRNACKKYKYLETVYSTNNSSCSSHPHNIYLEFLSENGLVGLASFFLLLIYYFYSSNTKIFMRINIAIPLIIFLWPIASTGSFFSNSNSSIFWFLLALFLVDQKQSILN